MNSKLFSITLHKKRAIGYALLGVLFMVLLYTQRNTHLYDNVGMGKAYLAGVPLAVVYALLGLLTVESNKKPVQLLLNLAWSLAVGVGLLLWTHCAVDTISFWKMEPVNMVYNLAVFFALGLLLYAITLRWKLSISLASVILFMWCVANGLVWQFRGKEIVFSDLAAAGTALSVAGQYIPELTLRITVGLSVWVLMMLAQFSIPKLEWSKKRRTRIIALTLTVVMAAAVFFGVRSITLLTYSTRGTTTNGTYLNFLKSIADSIIKEPEGYSVEVMDALEAEYADVQNQAGPNIIVVMNESFADLSVLGSELSTNQEVLPFYNSLKENIVRGYALTPAFGGATANAEFEFLTGHNMGQLPSGSYPYQQYIYGNVAALPWVMQEMGYDTFATHPMLATGWSRNKIYPMIGFEESTFMDDYPQQNLVREHVSDQETYEYVMEKMYAKEDGSKQFLFCITMQNHGGYRYEGENYTKHIELEGYSQEYPQAEQYLSVLHESDKALEYLITELENYPEDTVLLFFGDHLPNVEAELFTELHGKELETLDEQAKKRTVPFFVWANFDIEEKTLEENTCLSYLSLYLLEAAGLELPAYYQFLQEMEDVIPSMNNLGYYSRSRGMLIPYAEATGEEKEWLDQYTMVQYNNLFDEEGRSGKFFGSIPE